MCYSVKALLKTQLKKAIQLQDVVAIREITEKLFPDMNYPYHHVSGFSFPKLLIYTQESDLPKACRWGLIPHWVKDKKQARTIRSKTLNARIETMMQKPSFRDAAREKRCVLFIDGFFEYHHFMKKAYPFYVFNASHHPLQLAGLWSEYIDKETGEVIHTFSIVTTKAHGLLATIHNNPKLKEPRTPLILSDAYAGQWLDTSCIQTEKHLKDFANMPHTPELSAHTVGALQGKNYVGNVEGVTRKIDYPELALAF